MNRFLLLAAFCLGSLASQAAFSWQRFDEQVFAKAQRSHKMVLLHLRANWCHWCHVMEEQTYADPAMRDSLDAAFITCMEDHDARQDLTSRYKEYGWPATIIFDEHGKELYKHAGYIPIPEFRSVIRQLKADPDAFAGQQETAVAPDTNRSEAVRTVRKRFYQSLDFGLGGFDFMQKYLDFETFEYAFRHASEDGRLERWLHTSFRNSAGLCDPVWGGVYQYSTHGDWKHAHYEKLLAVQARYIKMYAWYYYRYGTPGALKRAASIAAYANRFLRAPGGGYYNAQDADLVQGEKATAYFALGNRERLRNGVPAVDKNVYTADNAQLAEALVYLWAVSGDGRYLKQSEDIAAFLQQQRRAPDGLYAHGDAYSATQSLNDQIYMAKALHVLGEATGFSPYDTAARALLKLTVRRFSAPEGYLYNFTGTSALPPGFTVSDNIEAARLLNLLGRAGGDTGRIADAARLRDYLTDPRQVADMATEPGILSALEEARTEPYSAVLVTESLPADPGPMFRAMAGYPAFYVQFGRYTPATLPEGKKEMGEGQTVPTVFFCNSSYCSAPLRDLPALRQYIHTQLSGKVDKKRR